MLCCDKNVQVAEISIKLLFILIKNVEGALMQLDPQALSYIMKAMAFLIDGKRQNMKTQALDMCMFMYNVMGGHNYMKLMEYALSPEEMQPMIQGMEYHRINKPKHVPLANLLRQRRTEQFTMKENYNTQNYNQNIQPKNNYYWCLVIHYVFIFFLLSPIIDLLKMCCRWWKGILKFYFFFIIVLILF